MATAKKTAAPVEEVVTETVEEVKEAPKKKAAPKTKNAKVNSTTGLNLRVAPGGEVVMILAFEDSVVVESTEGEWSKVKAGDNAGYVMTEFLTIE